MKHNRHINCFTSTLKMLPNQRYSTMVNNVKNCFFQRYEMHRNECIFKRLKNLWKEQFDVYILPVIRKWNNNMKKSETKCTSTQMTLTTDRLDNNSSILTEQFKTNNMKLESIDDDSISVNCSTLSSILSSLKDNLLDNTNFDENYLRNFEKNYVFNDSTESTNSTIYLYCSTCSYIVVCHNLDELKQFDITESNLSSSAYYLTYEDEEDICEEFKNDEGDSFCIDYLNPAYEWIKSNRPCSAPPKLISQVHGEPI
ncbi:unnamed protein product [Heterobilharzia americana]|nr:unnamed protein product [Heterobilharzia americana]